VTTSAITHNSATWTEHTFTITGTLLNPGDELEVFVQTAVNDSGGATGAIAEVGGVWLETTTRM
jgi:hypothetical protein